MRFLLSPPFPPLSPIYSFSIPKNNQPTNHPQIQKLPSKSTKKKFQKEQHKINKPHAPLLPSSLALREPPLHKTKKNAAVENLASLRGILLLLPNLLFPLPRLRHHRIPAPTRARHMRWGLHILHVQRANQGVPARQECVGPSLRV